MTPADIERVQDSFALVLPITEQAADEFYRRLFALAPETRVLFRNDMADQGRKLFLTLATVVDALDRLDTILPIARALAIRHVGYGVEDGHYAAVGVSLVETLRMALGARFDGLTEAAWEQAYAALSDEMRRAARDAAPFCLNVAASHDLHQG